VQTGNLKNGRNPAWSPDGAQLVLTLDEKNSKAAELALLKDFLPKKQMAAR
jgi:hypothetical protein